MNVHNHFGFQRGICFCNFSLFFVMQFCMQHYNIIIKSSLQWIDSFKSLFSNIWGTCPSILSKSPCVDLFYFITHSIFYWETWIVTTWTPQPTEKEQWLLALLAQHPPKITASRSPLEPAFHFYTSIIQTALSRSCSLISVITDGQPGTHGSQ